jgi:hypothetical protein
MIFEYSVDWLGGAADRVKVEVAMSGNREPLEKLLREEIGGNLAAVLDRLRERVDLSLPDFALRCREGKDALIKHYGLPPGARKRSHRRTKPCLCLSRSCSCPRPPRSS